MDRLKITMTRGLSKCTDRQVRTMRALGLRRIGDSVTAEGNLAIMGMLRKVSHLVSYTVEQEVGANQ
ncbi:MAG: 50S ribosomal protein L30 [Oscillospiraceae bacterium]|nr:50S ribosomal protein L30 [Oscillospiraceae bacterium]